MNIGKVVTIDSGKANKAKIAAALTSQFLQLSRSVGRLSLSLNSKGCNQVTIFILSASCASVTLLYVVCVLVTDSLLDFRLTPARINKGSQQGP